MWEDEKNEAIEVFYEDIKEKRSAISRPGGPGKKRPRVMHFPMDMGDQKTKREYKQSGVCFSYNIKEAYTMEPENLTFEEFLKIEDPLQARNIFKNYFCHLSDSALAEKWEILPGTIRSVRKRLGITKKGGGKVAVLSNNIEWPIELDMKGRVIGDRKRQFKNTEKTIENEGEEFEEGRMTPTMRRTTVPGASRARFEISLFGLYSSHKLMEKLSSLDKILDSSESVYFVDIVIKETEKETEKEDEGNGEFLGKA